MSGVGGLLLLVAIGGRAAAANLIDDFALKEACRLSLSFLSNVPAVSEDCALNVKPV
jgi:hypothetical protein